MKKWIALLGTTAVLVALGFVIQANSDTVKDVAKTWFENPTAKDSGQQHSAPTVTVISPKQRSFIETVFVTGTLVAKEQVLVAPEVSGQRVKELLVDIGDEVKKDQVLASYPQMLVMRDFRRRFGFHL